MYISCTYHVHIMYISYHVHVMWINVAVNLAMSCHVLPCLVVFSVVSSASYLCRIRVVAWTGLLSPRKLVVWAVAGHAVVTWSHTATRQLRHRELCQSVSGLLRWSDFGHWRCKRPPDVEMHWNALDLGILFSSLNILFPLYILVHWMSFPCLERFWSSPALAQKKLQWPAINIRKLRSGLACVEGSLERIAVRKAKPCQVSRCFKWRQVTTFRIELQVPKDAKGCQRQSVTLIQFVSTLVTWFYMTWIWNFLEYVWLNLFMRRLSLSARPIK